LRDDRKVEVRTDKVVPDEMPSDIDRNQVQKLVELGAQLVEVLPLDEYEEDHLPGAMSLPLKRLETDAVQLLDRTRPVIVYCWDTA
jgi:rhodanese-related sulfurtransferase